MVKNYFCIILIAFIFASCATAPDGILINNLTGVWQQVDGSSVLTIDGKYWEILDMERGWAGYGTDIKWAKREGKTYIDFRYLKNSYILNLSKYDNIHTTINGVQHRIYINGYIYLKDFMLKAWEEYKIPIEDRDYSMNSYGGGNKLFTIHFDNLYMSLIPRLTNSLGFEDCLTGTFVRIK